LFKQVILTYFKLKIASKISPIKTLHYFKTSSLCKMSHAHEKLWILSMILIANNNYFYFECSLHKT